MTTQDEPDVLIEGVKDYNFFEDAPSRILNINPSTEEIPEKETTRIRDCINIPECMLPMLMIAISITKYIFNERDKYFIKVLKIIIFLLALPFLFIIQSIVFYMLFLYFHWKRVIFQSFISAVIAIFTFF